jgi:hypothetical protein
MKRAKSKEVNGRDDKAFFYFVALLFLSFIIRSIVHFAGNFRSLEGKDVPSISEVQVIVFDAKVILSYYCASGHVSSSSRDFASDKLQIIPERFQFRDLFSSFSSCGLFKTA